MRYMKMKKIMMVVMLMLLLSGCRDALFEEDKAISKYALGKYAEELKKAEVKYLKCHRLTDGTMKVYYTKKQRDNSFPATVRFDYINKTYNVYFDNAYRNGPKEDLVKDIDECFECWQKQHTVDETWK